MSLDITTDVDEWNRWCREVGLEDPYYRLDYTRLWEREERAEAVGIRFESDAGTVWYPVLRDPLDFLPGSEAYCDIRTAYDFGGPAALGEEPGRAQREFQEAFDELVDDWNVVTEFARLHPYCVRERPEEATFHTQNIHASLSKGYDNVHEAYHKNQRNRIRDAEEAGVEIEVAEERGPKRRYADDFLRCYYETMERVGANPDYFFLPETLRALVDRPEMVLASALYDGGVVASGMFLCAGDVIFYFLSGSDGDYLDVRPNNLMLDRMVQYGVERDYVYLHLGGGSETLRHFKSQVGNGRINYYILTRVHDEAAYEELSAHATEDDQFPAYRMNKFEDRETPPVR